MGRKLNKSINKVDVKVKSIVKLFIINAYYQSFIFNFRKNCNAKVLTRTIKNK